jgi:hypothetical protein
MKRTKKQKARAADWKVLLFIGLIAVAINGTGFYFLFGRPRPQGTAPRVPHYFANIGAARPLPQTLDPAAFSNRDVAAAYQSAKEIPEVLVQQPCYCYCDRMGHNSLHSCFETSHGARCSTCLKELYYSYQQSKKGKTAAQIHAGIIKGEWKQIDLQSSGTIN